jgi:16S rRNA (guanine966-N2)-methyltransferase
LRKHSLPVPVRDNRVRIIAGRWKGRKISFPDGNGLRPTGDRIRETLFNWLMPVLPGMRCLDLFAGSGALGLEALSRGAAHCVLVEQNPEAVRHLQASLKLLCTSDATIVCADAKQWLESATGIFDLLLLDPPFADKNVDVQQVVNTLVSRGLLAPRSWIYLEQAQTDVLPHFEGFQVYRQQQAGFVRVSLWCSVSKATH